MSVLLYLVGAVAVAAGAITIAFGFSIELSFGNSLIVAGTSATVGGLIVVGLGAVVAQLQRIAEGLGAAAPARPGRVAETFEAPGAPRAAAPRVPFPPKPKAARPAQPAEAPVAAPAAEMPAEDHFAASPSLPNPEEPPVEVHEEVSLSPFQPVVPAPADVGEAARPSASPPGGYGAVGGGRSEAEPGLAWRLPPIPARREPAPPEEPSAPPPAPRSFETMWPAPEPKSAEKPEPTAETVLPEPKVEPKAAPEAQAAAGEPRAVAILKSGVVDGMGYTLYVDGSIEAELPQGMLRFASINDLRDYLEHNTQP